MRIIFVNEKGASKSFPLLVFLSWALISASLVISVSIFYYWERSDFSAYGLQQMKEELSIQEAELHEIENTRDAILNQGDSAIEAFLQNHRGADRQQLRQLRRQAVRENDTNKPPAAARKLFRYIREVMSQA